MASTTHPTHQKPAPTTAKMSAKYARLRPKSPVRHTADNNTHCQILACADVGVSRYANCACPPASAVAQKTPRLFLARPAEAQGWQE